MTFILSYPILAIGFLLTIIVFIHELGHFLVGKLFSVGIETFSIGFGPKIFSFNWRATQYQLALLPLGGYVKFAGALPSEPVAANFIGKELFRASPYVRALILLAGPLANLLLAGFIFAYLGMQGVEHPAAIIGEVRTNSPAYHAGLKSGDEIITVEGKQVKIWDDLQQIIVESPAKKLSLSINRNHSKLNISLIPEIVQQTNLLGKPVTIGRAGISPGFLPAIITVLDQNSEAYLKGLRTGDKITTVSWFDHHNQINSSAIHYWSEFLEVLKIIEKNKITLLTIESESYAKKVANDLKTTLISTSAWDHFEKKSSELAEKIGLSSSQLTIAKIEDDNLNKILQFGDNILSWNGKPIVDIHDLLEELSEGIQQKVKVLIVRDGKSLTKEIELEPTEGLKGGEQVTFYRLNVNFLGSLVLSKQVIEQYHTFSEAIVFSYKKTSQTAKLIFDFLVNLITGQASFRGLGGPLMIMKVADESAKAGLRVYLQTIALISVNLGIVNLAPLPALDGGQLVVAITEMIRRRPLHETTIIQIQKLGFVIILCLFFLSTTNDVRLLWGQFFRGIFNG